MRHIWKKATLKVDILPKLNLHKLNAVTLEILGNFHFGNREAGVQVQLQQSKEQWRDFWPFTQQNTTQRVRDHSSNYSSHSKTNSLLFVQCLAHASHGPACFTPFISP